MSRATQYGVNTKNAQQLVEKYSNFVAPHLRAPRNHEKKTKEIRMMTSSFLSPFTFTFTLLHQYHHRRDNAHIHINKPSRQDRETKEQEREQQNGNKITARVKLNRLSYSSLVNGVQDGHGGDSVCVSGDVGGGRRILEGEQGGLLEVGVVGRPVNTGGGDEAVRVGGNVRV